MSGEKPVGEMSFEEAMDALEHIVEQLESGRVELDRSIQLYERGEALKKRCEEKLSEAELRVRQITPGSDGAAGAKPVEIE